MRTHSALTLLASALFVIVAVVADAEAEIQAGVGRETFALPARVPLAGYSRRHGQGSTGVHDAPGVRALVFRDGETMAALVSCDLLIVDERLADAVRARLQAHRLAPRLILVLAATHTHSGPGAYGTKFFEKISMGHFSPAVFDALVDAMVHAVVRASDNAGPVRIGYGTALAQGLVQNRVDPGGLVDPQLTVVGFYRPEAANPFAVAVSFSAHPTTLGAWNMELSGDYPGVVMRELERRVPGATCLFFAGSVGDQAPEKSGDGFERTERLGLPLAEQAADVLATMRPETPERLAAHQELMALPPAQLRFKRLVIPRWIGARFVDDDATLSVLSVGRTVFLGVPCDLTASLGRQVAQAAEAQGMRPMVVGFAGDYIGYCVPEALYRDTQYESFMAFNGPRAGDLIVERLIQMLGQ